jgi:hypothetical protein
MPSSKHSKWSRSEEILDPESDPESNEPKPRSFTFVSSQDKCNARRIARSHVGREIWRQRRLEEIHTQLAPGKLVWRLKNTPVAKKAAGKAVALCPTAVVPGTTHVNPFPNFDLDYGEGTQELLHHCKPVSN